MQLQYVTILLSLQGLCKLFPVKYNLHLAWLFLKDHIEMAFFFNMDLTRLY